MRYLQTGDVLYKKIDAIPKDAKIFKSNLIHQGNNHKHIISGKFTLYKKENDLFIKATGKCKLLHDEHKTIEMDNGIYKKDILLEYDHFLEESRAVID